MYKNQKNSGSSVDMVFTSQICEEIGVKAPVNVKMFTGKGKLLDHSVNFVPLNMFM